MRDKSRNCWSWIALLSVLLAVALANVPAAAREDDPPQRARPPVFAPPVVDIFSSDARQLLEGDRPRPKPGATKSAVSADGAEPKHSKIWSRLISAEALEDEIKAQQIVLGGVVANATRFKSGDYLNARQSLNTLAAMFFVIDQFDQPVRWQQEAAAVHVHLGRAAANCKVGSDASFREAKSRHEDLTSLVRGAGWPAPTATNSWEFVAERAPLMLRLEEAHSERIEPAISNPAELARQADKLAHEAQIIAVLAEIVSMAGNESADDETYQQAAGKMRTQAALLRTAAGQRQYEPARAAAGELGKACASCHEKFRN